MMFKNNIKIYILSIVCALTFALPSLAKAQLNQHIVTGPSLPATYFFQPNDFEVGSSIYASSGLPLQYASSNNAVATIVGNKIRAVSVGSFVLTLSQPGNATYNPAPPLSFTVTIVQGSQSISFPQPSTKGLTDPDFNPGASSSSGLAITYTSSNTAVATIVGGQVHIVGAGSTEIRASQAGNANYAAATTISRTLYVSGNTQTISFPAITKNFNDPIFSPSATASSGFPITYYTSSDPNVAVVQGQTNVRIVGVGTSVITAYQTGSSTVQAASASTTLTVGKGNQTIAMTTAVTNNYLTADYVPNASASSGLPLSFTSSNTAVATIVAGKIHITGTGTTTITASQPGNANYNAAADATQTLVIIKSNQFITFPNIPSKPLAAADFDPGATASSNLAVNYTSSNPAVATIVAGKIHIVGLGSTTITASQAGDANFEQAGEVSKGFTVTGGTQVVTFPAIATKTFGEADFNPGASSNTGLEITYSSSNAAVATIVANQVHITGVGSTQITATQLGNENFASASETVTLTVVKGTQTISFGTIPVKLRSDVDFDLGGSASSFLPVTYTSSNPAVATIVGTKLRFLGAGTAVITATQAGNANYDAAAPVSQNLTVNKGIQVINFPSLPGKSLADIDFDPSATSNSGLPIVLTSSNLAVATIVSGKIHLVSAGTSIITASHPGDANYEPASTSRTLTVTAIPQTITFPDIPTKTLASADFNPGATTTSGLPITYVSSNLSVATIVGGMVHIVGSGNAQITATQPGNGTYLAAISISKFLQVNGNSTQTITFPPISSRPFDAFDFDPGAISSSGLELTYTSSNLAVATIVANKIHIIGVGTTTITANQAGSAEFTSATASTTFTVTKATPTIVFNEIPAKTVNDPDFTLFATTLSGLPITYTSSDPSVATLVSLNKVDILQAGSVVITANVVGNANYNAATASQTLTIGKGSQVITFPEIPARPLTSPDFDPGATANSSLPISYTSSNPAVATIVGGQIHVVGLGFTTITASQGGNTSYDPAPNVSRIFMVSNGGQTVTMATTFTKVFGESDFDPGATSNSGLAITYLSSNPAVATIVDNRIHITGVGTSLITGVQLGNETYASAQAQAVLTVTKASQTITLFNPTVTKFRTDADYDPGAVASSGLPIIYYSTNLSVATIVANRVHIVGQGVVRISATQAGNENFNPATAIDQELTVIKGAQFITFPDMPVKSLSSPDFDPGATSSVPSLLVTYTSSNPDVATIVAGKVHIVGNGTSVITASQLGNNDVSAAADVSKTLTVNGTAQIITFPAIANKKLTDADFEPGATVNTSLPLIYTSSNLDVATIVNNKIHIVGGGTTTITATQVGNAVYAQATASVTLTVDKNVQTITFPAISAKELNAADFDPGATASSGLAITYTSSNTAVATIVANKIHVVGPGTTTITANQAGNATFAAATAASVQLTVNKANQTITFPAISLKVPTDADFDLNATASSGLAISYRSSNTAVATIVAGKVHIVAAGSAVITASQAGNATFNAATEVSQTLDVVYTLPPSNFSVKATDETCKTSNNGSINITAVQALSYTASITVNGGTTTYPFSTVLAVNNLQAGTYNVCITVAGQPTYKQCFDVTIKEPKDLAVYSSIRNDGNSVFLKLEGSDTYRIELNGQVINTSDQEISLPLVKGNNIVKISSDKSCQGVITKTFLTTNSISLYPNPVKSVLNITTGSSESNAVKVDIHGLDGRLVHTSQHKSEYGQVSVDLSKLNKGLYVLTLTVGNSKTVHKIIKD